MRHKLAVETACLGQAPHVKKKRCVRFVSLHTSDQPNLCGGTTVRGWLLHVHMEICVRQWQPCDDLCCAVLCCAVLCCAVLCCAVLCVLSAYRTARNWDICAQFHLLRHLPRGVLWGDHQHERGRTANERRQRVPIRRQTQRKGACSGDNSLVGKSRCVVG